MWIASLYGFFSIVRKPEIDKAHPYQIRARDPLDLTELVKHCPVLHDRPIIHTPDADYPARICVDQPQLDAVFSALQASLGYENFKGAIARTPSQQDKGEAYHDIWAIMARFQHSKVGHGPYGQKRSRHAE